MCHQTRGGIPISIHSLRVEGDKKEVVHVVHKHNFNPLPPCGGRQNKHFVRWRQIYFNPLPPCGGRPDKCDALEHFQDFNPLPPCGGRPLFASIRVPHFVFQSTPSVWRETDDWVEHFKTYYPFQSTPSVWRETYTSFIVVVSLTFQSTPSVWRETIDGYKNVDRLKHFNPLPPCGGRLPFEIVSCRHIDFNPLPPCGGRLLDIWVKIRVGLHFNPLPPCGGRQIRMINYDVATHFNPLPPCGGRPECLIKASRNVVFQSTPSVWRETRRRLAAQVFMRNFNPLPPCGGRPCSYYYSIKIRNISIHSIRVEGDRPQRRP